jgi:hypothetical protein
MGARLGNNNAAGVGGFADRPWDRWRFGAPGCVACGARSKRTGLPCRCPPMKGSLRCYLHGGRSKGRGKRLPPMSLRALQNREAQAARRMAREELAGAKLHPDTMPTWRKDYFGRVYGPDVERFLLMLDRRLKGDIDMRAWFEIKARFGV